MFMVNFQFSIFFAMRRKEMKVTQEEVANYVGVSKAAISKWEKGQSYPDITLLPKLATFFNISIDDLLGYEPQLTPQKIEKLYSEFAKRMNDEPFEQVELTLEQHLVEYYSCFPFVLKMAQFYINYYRKAQQPERILQRVEELTGRVIGMSNDNNLIIEATTVKALIKLLQQDYEETLQLLGQEPRILFGEEVLIANAHLMQGNQQKAKEVLQVSHYQHLLMAVACATESLLIDMENFSETVRRMKIIIDTYELEKLNVNSALVFYVKAATGFMMLGDEQRALQIMESYVKCVSNITYPIQLKGDEYFDTLTHWIKRITNMGTQQPRSEEAIKHDLYTTIAENPVFAPLHENKQYKALLMNLKYQLKGE